MGRKRIDSKMVYAIMIIEESRPFIQRRHTQAGHQVLNQRCTTY